MKVHRIGGIDALSVELENGEEREQLIHLLDPAASSYWREIGRPLRDELLPALRAQRSEARARTASITLINQWLESAPPADVKRLLDIMTALGMGTQ